MNRTRFSRRKFVSGAGVIGAGVAFSGRAFSQAADGLHIASNEYSWTVFFARENRDFKKSLDEGLRDVARSTLDGLEPFCEKPEEVDRIAPLLKKHGLEMRSLYVNSTLHDAAIADASIDQILAVARKAKTVGTRIIVTNPSPYGGEDPRTKMTSS